MVAPHAGAWIETPPFPRTAGKVSVAPHAGAWIETDINGQLALAMESRPTRARGLKLASPCIAHLNDRVAPHAGAWIETN